MIYFKIWLIIGCLVNLWYHYKNRAKYVESLHRGEVTYINFIIGGVLTIFLWPISIYNNEKL